MASKKFLVDIDLAQNQLLNGVFQVLASAPGAPVEGQIYYNSTSKKFWGWNGTAWADLSNTGSGNTNLTFSRDGTTVTVESSTGSDATLPAATTTLAGVMTGADKTKLDGIAAGANKIDNATQVPFNNTNIGFTATDVQDAIDEVVQFVNGAVSGGVKVIGSYNPSTNTPDLTVSPTGIKKGYQYLVVADGNFFAEEVENGDTLTALQDNPTQLSHWIRNNKNIPNLLNASTTAKGLVEEATEAEAKNPSAETGGTGAKLFVTPKQLHAAVNDKTDLVRTYNVTVGNGSATDFTVTHNLNKIAVVVQVFTFSDGKQVEVLTEIINANSFKVYFNTAPTNNQYRVVVHA